MVYNRYLNNRPLGSTKFGLHRLLDEPSIQLAASLVDANDKPLKVIQTIDFNKYNNILLLKWTYMTQTN